MSPLFTPNARSSSVGLRRFKPWILRKKAAVFRPGRSLELRVVLTLKFALITKRTTANFFLLESSNSSNPCSAWCCAKESVCNAQKASFLSPRKMFSSAVLWRCSHALSDCRHLPARTDPHHSKYIHFSKTHDRLATCLPGWEAVYRGRDNSSLYCRLFFARAKASRLRATEQLENLLVRTHFHKSLD